MTKKDQPAKHAGNRTSRTKRELGAEPTPAELAEAAAWARAAARGQTVPGRNRRTK